MVWQRRFPLKRSTDKAQASVQTYNPICRLGLAMSLPDSLSDKSATMAPVEDVPAKGPHEQDQAAEHHRSRKVLQETLRGHL